MVEIDHEGGEFKYGRSGGSKGRMWPRDKMLMGYTTLGLVQQFTATTQLDRTWVESDLIPHCEELRGSTDVTGTLRGLSLYCLFYEPSFLTRTSFERAIGLLGGEAYHTEDATQFFPVKSPNHIDNILGILTSLHIDLVVLRSSSPGVMERASIANVVPVVNGGSLDDHPTQAIADIYTIHRELGHVDDVHIAIVGRLEHRNVSALLRGLALFEGVKVTLMPFSGNADPDVLAYCNQKGIQFVYESELESLREVDCIYLNGPKTLAHMEVLKSRGRFNLRIDGVLMGMLKSSCIVMDPMQRSGDFEVEVEDDRLAFYRQAENALYARMAVISQMLLG